jgi:hypothetical protein
VQAIKQGSRRYNVLAHFQGCLAGPDAALPPEQRCIVARKENDMSKRNVGIGVGIGAAGALAYIAARLIMGGRKKREAALPVEKKPAPPEPDARPKDIACPECGAPVREYEFFCPACKHPMEKDRAADAGAAEKE